MRNTRVFDLEPGQVLSGIYGPVVREAKGMSKAAETRVAREVREGLKRLLTQVVKDAFTDGFKIRSGNARNVMLFGGVRSFGTTLSSIRGHIIGPGYIKAQEEGVTIRAKQAKGLAIPFAYALKPDGTPKLPGPRSWQNIRKTYWFKSKKTGKVYLVYKQGDNLRFLYVLVDEVQLRKNVGVLSRAWDKQKPELIRILGAAMLREFGEVDIKGMARVTDKKSKKGGGSRRGRRR